MPRSRTPQQVDCPRPYACRVDKIEMRATLSEHELDVLEAWVNEHADEFATVAIYKEGLTLYRVGNARETSERD